MKFFLLILNQLSKLILEAMADVVDHIIQLQVQEFLHDELLLVATEQADQQELKIRSIMCFAR